MDELFWFAFPIDRGQHINCLADDFVRLQIIQIFDVDPDLAQTAITVVLDLKIERIKGGHAAR